MKPPFLAFIIMLIIFLQKNKNIILFLLGIYLFIHKIPTVFCEVDHKISESLIKMISDILTEYYKSPKFKLVFGNNLYYCLINEKYIINFIYQTDWSSLENLIQNNVDEELLYNFIQQKFNTFVINNMLAFDSTVISIIVSAVIKVLEYKPPSVTILKVRSSIPLLSYFRTLIQAFIQWILGF